MYNYEIVHYFEEDLKIFSKANKIFIENNTKKFSINMPRTKYDLFSFSRIFRRLLRTDKCNVFLINKSEDRYLIIRQNAVYLFKKDNLKFLFNLSLARNLLHVDLCRTPSGKLYFGEYGANLERNEVPIYLSDDQGESWRKIYVFERKSTKHIHCVKYDPYSKKIWVFTGDDNGECKILVANEEFTDLEFIGDGTQNFRACNVFFLKDKVVWMMDSPEETSYCVHFNRQTKEISKHYRFEGPVWYSQEMYDDYYICGSSVEPGYSMANRKAQVLVSTDLIDWKVVLEFKKDFWHIDYFKYGVVGFPVNKQRIDKVQMFGEALVGIDGKIKEYDCSI